MHFAQIQTILDFCILNVCEDGNNLDFITSVGLFYNY